MDGKVYTCNVTMNDTHCSRFCEICSIKCSFGLVTNMMFCTLLGGSPLSDSGNIFSTSCSCGKMKVENDYELKCILYLTVKYKIKD